MYEEWDNEADGGALFHWLFTLQLCSFSAESHYFSTEHCMFLLQKWDSVAQLKPSLFKVRLQGKQRKCYSLMNYVYNTI